MKDLKRSLHDKGNFRLSRDYQNYHIPDMTWNQKSEEQQKRAFMNFLNDKKNKPHPDTIVSADGKLSLPKKAQNISKKPGQKKVSRSERTRSKEKK